MRSSVLSLKMGGGVLPFAVTIDPKSMGEITVSI